MVVSDISRIDSDVLECIIESFAIVTEHNSTVMRIILADELVAVETAHFLYCEYAYAAE